MLKEKVVKLTKLLFAGLTMALCVAVVSPVTQVKAEMLEETEPNNRRATANKIPLNTWVTGELASYGNNTDTEDWFQFTIPEGRGYSWFEIRPTLDNINNDSDWRFTLKDANDHTLYETNGHSFSTWEHGWKPGKYYIQITHGWNPKDSYKFMMHYTKSSEWEAEEYYTGKTVNTAYLNKRYTGSIYCNRDVDYYLIKLSGTNKVSLKFTIDDSVLHPGGWYLKFTEYNSRRELGEYTVYTNDTITIPKCTGDLRVEIRNASYESSNNQIYHIQASVKSNTVKKPSTTAISSIKAGKCQATVYWRKANNATGYYVYRSTSASSGFKKIATVTGKTSYTDKKSLTSKKTYYYKVVSIRKSGSKILTAKASAAKKVKIQ